MCAQSWLTTYPRWKPERAKFQLLHSSGPHRYIDLNAQKDRHRFKSRWQWQAKWVIGGNWSRVDVDLQEKALSHICKTHATTQQANHARRKEGSSIQSLSYLQRGWGTDQALARERQGIGSRSLTHDNASFGPRTFYWVWEFQFYNSSCNVGEIDLLDCWISLQWLVCLRLYGACSRLFWHNSFSFSSNSELLLQLLSKLLSLLL